MMLFGNSFGHDDERQQGCARFVCSLYRNNAKIWTDFDKNCSAARMHTPAICRQPNMLSSIMSHEQITRPAFGTITWKRQPYANICPHGHGWDVIDGHISIHWMDQQPAPKALLQFISCNCLKGRCVGGRCSCRKNVMCTDACGCVECSNTQDIGRTENDSSDEDED